MDISIDIHTDEDTKFIIARSQHKSSGDVYHTVTLRDRTSFPSVRLYLDNPEMVRLRDDITAHLATK